MLFDISQKPIIIIGNKKYSFDDNRRKVSYEAGKNYANNKGYNFYEVSSETGENIEVAFNGIFEQLYLKFEDEIKGRKKKNAHLNRECAISKSYKLKKYINF